MATRKQKDDFGDFDFDSDLDFDFDIAPKSSRKQKDKKPITHIIDGAKAGLISKFQDPSTYKTMLRKALPDPAGVAWDAIETVAQDSRELYDQSIKELGPGIAGIARKVDTLMPDSATRAKRWTKELSDKLSMEMPDNYSSNQASAEDQSVERVMAELGQRLDNGNLDQEERNKTQRILDEHIANKRYNTQQAALNITANNTSSIRSYLTGFNVKYQYKSLELQTRTYFAIASLVKMTADANARAREFQDGLLLNTSLPDYAKTSNTERWKQISKEQIFGRLNDGLFGGKSRVALAGQRLMKAGKEKIANSKEALSDIDGLLEMLIDSREMAQMDAEMNGRKYSGWNTAGVFGGNMVGDAISNAISERLKKFAEKNPKLMKGSYNVGRYAANPGAIFEKIRGSKRFKDMGNSENELTQMLQSMGSSLMDLLAGEKPDMTIKSTAIGTEGENKLHTQTRVNRAIIDVMPGYMAMMLRELTMIRTGDKKTGLMVYDERTGTFKTDAKVRAGLMETLSQQAASSRAGSKGDTYAESADKLYKSFVGKESTGAADPKAIRGFLTKMARSSDDMDFTGPGIRKTKEYQALDKDTRAVVDAILDKRFTGDTELDSARKYRLTNAMNSTRSSIGNLMGPIQEMIRDGHGERLEKEGVITRDKEGRYNVNEDAYYKFFDDSTTIKSDFDVKGNIRPSRAGGTASLNAFKRTQNYTWNYKQGSGYGQQQYTGPMAQHVRQNFGEDTAPGGKSIDLVSMNGHTMDAVKKLADMVESMGAGEAVNLLRKIEENTRGGVSGNIKGGMGPGGFQSDGSLSGNAGALFASLLGKAGEGARYAGEKASQGASAAGKAAQDFWTNNREDFKRARDKVIAMSVTAAQKAAEFGNDLLYNQLPKLRGRAGELWGKTKDFIKNIFQEAKDLYVAGSQSPAIKAVLLKAGQYRDEATGQIMRTMDDIASSKGNIVDAYGRVVLSLEDRANGVFDSSGQKLKSFLAGARDTALGAGAWALGHAQNAMSGLKNRFDKINFAGMGRGIADKATQAKDRASKMLSGKFGIGFGGDDRILPVLVQIRDLISLDHRGKRGKAIMARKIQGLEMSPDMNDDDSYTGQSSNSEHASGGSQAEKIADAIASGNAGAAARAMGSGAAGAAGNLFGMDFKGMAASARGMFDRFKGSPLAGKLGSRMRGFSLGKLGGKFAPMKARLSGLGGKLGRFGGGALGILGSIFGGGGEGAQAKSPEESGMNTYGAGDHAARMAELNAGTEGNAYKKGAKPGDRDGDGQRDGGAADRMQDAANAKRANEERKRAGIEASQRGAQARASRYAPEEGAMSKMISAAMAGLSSIAGMASNLIGGIGSIFGLGKGIVGTGGKVLGTVGKAAMGLGRGVLGAASLGGGMLGQFGTGMINAASKVPGAASLGRLALGATRIATVAGLATGGATSMLSATAALGGALLTNPIVLGALGVAAVGYAGYKAYKYLTKNNIDDFERIRIMQYGLSGNDDTKAYNSKCLALEKYFLEGRVAFSMGTPSINGRMVKNEELLEIMDIPTDDQRLLNNFNEWLNGRFAPVFLKHVGALYRVDPKASLEKVSSLDGEKQADYLSNVEVGGIWSIVVSPFKGLDVLSSNAQPVRDLIASVIKKARSDSSSKKKGSSTKTTVSSNLPSKEALDARSAEKEAQKEAPATLNVPKYKTPALPANSQAAKFLAGNPGLAAQVPMTPSTNSTMGFGGNGVPATGLSDGSMGMKYVKLGKDAVLDGLHPRMKEAFLGMAQEYGERTGKQLPVNEAFRSFKRQAELYAKHPDKAARPGSSLHEYGLAMDIPTVVMKELEDLGLLKKYGFTRPVRGETWHMEPSGIQASIQAVKSDPSLADKLIQASMGRGGGGIGAVPSAKKGGRDLETAKSVFGADLANAANLPAKSGGGAQPSAETDVDTGKGPQASGDPATTRYSRAGADGSVRSTGAFDASASIGDGSGKYDKVKADIAKYAIEGGQEPNKMILLAAMESSLDPNARSKTSSATGPNQFIDSTWKEQINKHGSKYGLDAGADRTNTRASTLMASEYMKGKEKYLSKAKGSAVDIVDEYMGHMFGQGGAASLLRADPNASAASILPKAAASNRETFYANGRARTVGELRQFLAAKLSKKAKEFGIQVPGLNAQDSSIQPGGEKPAGGMMKLPFVPGADQGPVPITTGYALPNVATREDPSMRASGVGFDAPAPARRANPLTAPRPVDTSLTASVEMFERFNQKADTQIEHLSSIDAGVQQMIPLLQEIAQNTKSRDEESESSKSPKSSNTPAPAPARPRNLSVRKQADVSSFDNRRALPA